MITKPLWLLEEAFNSGCFEFYYLELTTGLRLGEILALEWDDLDINKRTLTINKMFYNGLGVEKDIDAAIYYFEKAVKGKNLFAAYQLGKIYSSEEGYIDMSKAIDYFIIYYRKIL